MADLNAIVEKYIQLRDKKAQLKRAFEAETESIDQMLDKCEAYLQQQMTAQGVLSVATKAGTAYRSTRVSAKVEDWDAALAHIIATQNWAMLERRVAKEAVVQFREEHDDLPPGVSWREEVTINVRRS